MTAQEEIIRSIKQLQNFKDELWNMTWQVFFYADLYRRADGEDYKKEVKENLIAAFQLQDGKKLLEIVQNSKRLHSFVGNDLYYLYGKYESLLIGLNVSVKSDLKRNDIQGLNNHSDILQDMDDKYKCLLSMGILTYSSLVKVQTEMDKDFTEMANAKLESLSRSDIHITGDNPIFGNQNTVGNNNKVRNNTNTKISLTSSIKFFKDEHPYWFWLQIAVDLFAVFLTLVQLGWIKLS